MKKSRLLGAVCTYIFVLLLSAMPHLVAHAATILETAPLGTTNGGTSISDMQYLGARFSLNDTYRIEEIGGHVKSSSTYDDRSIFVAVVPTNNPDNLPADITLNDAIYATTFEAPFNDEGPYPYQVDETIISTSFILDPGNYAVIFGSGLFGATGSGWMPVSGSIQATPWLIQGKWAGDYFRQIALALRHRPAGADRGGREESGLISGNAKGQESSPKRKFRILS